MMLIVPDPNGVDPQALAERRRKKSRRRAALWGAFLLLGLALGTIYATGFATTGGADGTTASADPNNNQPAANEDTSALDNKITSNGALTYDWAGRWGSVDSFVMYEVDLTTFTASDKFFSEVLLTNTPTKFSDLQLQLRIATDGGDGCDVTDLEGTAATNNRVMIFDNDDAQVTFSGMAGVTTGLTGGAGAVYCIGVVDYGPNPESGKDTGGTFIRKSENGGAYTGVYPEFVATLNRMS